MNRRRFALASAALALSPVAALSANAAESEGVRGAARLEARLLAPCCWTQTLDVHDSEISVELRREIRARLRAGESADAIEDDLVARYGERIRAASKGHEIGAPIPVVVGLGMAATGVALAALLRRWRRASSLTAAPSPKGPLAGGGEGDRYDEKLDEELRAFSNDAG